MSDRQVYAKVFVQFVLFLLALGCLLVMVAVIIAPVPPPISKQAKVDKSEVVRLTPKAMAEQTRVLNERMEQQARGGQ